MENLIFICSSCPDSGVVLYGPVTFIIDSGSVLISLQLKIRVLGKERSLCLSIEIVYNGYSNAFGRTSVERDFGMVKQNLNDFMKDVFWALLKHSKSYAI